MPQTLYLFVGYPGAGKTTVARIIAQATGAVHIWADHERHQLFGPTPTHSPEESRQLYAQLNQKAAQLLNEGKSVIFDTNFNFRRDRDKLRAIATSAGAKTVIIWITTVKELARRRAVEDSLQQDTRIWGNMPGHEFARISGHLQPPAADEHAVQIDGTHVEPEHIKQLLGI